MKYILAVLSLLAAPAYGETLFTKAENGTVSLNKGLTANECNRARKTALGLPVTDEEIKRQKDKDDAFDARAKEWNKTHPCRDESKGCTVYTEASSYFIRNSDIVKAECLK